MNEDVIFRFLNKKGDNSDLRQIAKWISESDENKKWLFGMEDLWSLKDKLKYSDKKEIAKAYKLFLEANGQNMESKTRIKLTPAYFKIAAIAASVAIIALLSANLFMMSSLDESYYDVSANVNVNEIDVPRGQIVTLTMSDKTKVYLNAETKFIYPSRFSKKNRIVKIIGEGFFEVEHNKESPFIVQSGSVNTTVLGTKFNVKAYHNEEISVTLLEGIVEVSKDQEEGVLRLDRPNQQVDVSKNGFMRRGFVDAEILSQWTTGELYFVDKTLASIANTLERKFNVEISIQTEELSKTIFNSRIQKDASLNEILKILKETRKLDYSINEKQVYFKEPS